jgi:hypothetical protein
MDYYLNEISNYQDAAAGALVGGHIDIFKDLLRTGITLPKDKWNWELLAMAVAKSGNKETINSILLISGVLSVNLNDGLLNGAAQLGNHEIFHYLVNPIVTMIEPAKWNKLFNHAVASQNIDFLNYFLTLVPSGTIEVTDEHCIYPLMVGNIPLFNYVRGLIPQNQLQSEP